MDSNAPPAVGLLVLLAAAYLALIDTLPPWVLFVLAVSGIGNVVGIAIGLVNQQRNPNAPVGRIQAAWALLGAAVGLLLVVGSAILR